MAPDIKTVTFDRLLDKEMINVNLKYAFKLFREDNKRRLKGLTPVFAVPEAVWVLWKVSDYRWEGDKLVICDLSSDEESFLLSQPSYVYSGKELRTVNNLPPVCTPMENGDLYLSYICYDPSLPDDVPIGEKIWIWRETEDRFTPIERRNDCQ
jgi:hypothetical protein